MNTGRFLTVVLTAMVLLLASNSLAEPDQKDVGKDHPLLKELLRGQTYTLHILNVTSQGLTRGYVSSRNMIFKFSV